MKNLEETISHTYEFAFRGRLLYINADDSYAAMVQFGTKFRGHDDMEEVTIRRLA